MPTVLLARPFNFGAISSSPLFPSPSPARGEGSKKAQQGALKFGGRATIFKSLCSFRAATSLKPIMNRSYLAGLGFALTAYLTWGILPLYWVLLREVNPVEVLAHR